MNVRPGEVVRSRERADQLTRVVKINALAPAEITNIRTGSGDFYATVFTFSVSVCTHLCAFGWGGEKVHNSPPHCVIQAWASPVLVKGR